MRPFTFISSIAIGVTPLSPTDLFEKLFDQCLDRPPPIPGGTSHVIDRMGLISRRFRRLVDQRALQGFPFQQRSRLGCQHGRRRHRAEGDSDLTAFPTLLLTADRHGDHGERLGLASTQLPVAPLPSLGLGRNDDTLF